MSDYTITTDFGAKDSLPSGNAAKVIKGSEFTTEFTNIQTAVNTKADTAGDTFTGAVTFDAAVTVNSTATITGDLTVDTNTLFVDVSENRVGIGTTSPAGNLHISAGTSGDATLILEADTDNSEEADNPKLQLRQDGNGVQGEMYMEGESGATASGSVANSLLLEARNSEGTNHIQFVTGGSNTTSTNGNVRMTIKNDGNVGIGTNSPQAPLHVHGDINLGNNAGADAADVEIASLNFYNRDTSNSAPNNAAIIRAYSSQATGSGGYLTFATSNGTEAEGADATEKMRIDSSGKVGIGTDSPATSLHVLNTGTTAISDAITNSGAILDGGTGNIGLNMITPNTGACYINFGDSADSNVGRLIYNHNNNAMSFDTNATERMRIDGSGNLLVGKITNSVDVAGGLIRVDGKISACVEGDYAGIFHRKTSSGDDADGAIVHFRKDSTTVGSIGTNDSDYLYVGNGDTNIAFSAGSDLIFPRGSEGIQRDAAIDLGNDSNRFKDLYLSGGVHLGGTGNANKLDDYEEGTWTPTASDNVDTVSNPSGSYTKIGRLVTVNFSLSVDLTTNATFHITGLPFNVLDGVGNTSIEATGVAFSDDHYKLIYAVEGASKLVFAGNILGTQTEPAFYRGSITYFTT